MFLCVVVRLLCDEFDRLCVVCCVLLCWLRFSVCCVWFVVNCCFFSVCCALCDVCSLLCII